jgi:hypothetical protein
MRKRKNAKKDTIYLGPIEKIPKPEKPFMQVPTEKSFQNMDKRLNSI